MCNCPSGSGYSAVSKYVRRFVVKLRGWTTVFFSFEVKSRQLCFNSQCPFVFFGGLLSFVLILTNGHPSGSGFDFSVLRFGLPAPSRGKDGEMVCGMGCEAISHTRQCRPGRSAIRRLLLSTVTLLGDFTLSVA